MKKMLNVDGITCDHCVKTIKESLEKIVGTYNIHVNIEQKQVILDFDEKKIKLEDLILEIGKLGFVVKI